MPDRALAEDTDQAQLERESRREFKSALPRTWNTYSAETDLGTDFILAVGSEDHRGGARVEVQLKATETKVRDGPPARQMKVSTVNSLLRSPLPVAVVLYVASSGDLFWTDLRAHARNRLDAHGAGWQDQRTISIPFDESRSLSDVEDFRELITGLLSDSEFNLNDILGAEDHELHAAHGALLDCLLQRRRGDCLAANKALNLLSSEISRALDDEELGALLTQHAGGVVEYDSETDTICLVEYPTTGGIRNVLSLHQERAPTTLHNLGWLSSIDPEDMGYLLFSLQPESLESLAFLENLEEVDPAVWLSVIMRFLVDNPEPLRDLPDTTLTEETPRQSETGATGIIRRLDFSPERWGSTVRDALSGSPADGFVVVPDGDKAYLVETEAVESKEQDLPSLSVQGVKEGPIETRTPIMVYTQPEVRRLTRVLGQLNHRNHPALRILASEGGDFKSPEIEGNQLLQLPGQTRTTGYGDDGESYICAVEGFVFFELLTEVSINDDIMPDALSQEHTAWFQEGEIDLRIPLYETPRLPGFPVSVIEFFEERGMDVELGPRPVDEARQT